MNTKTDDELRKIAEKRADEMGGFYIHFTAYVLVNVMFITIWAWEGMNSFPWWIFMTCGWGIGVMAHFVGAFISPDLLDKMVEKEFQKLKEQQEGKK